MSKSSITESFWIKYEFSREMGHQKYLISILLYTLDSMYLLVLHMYMCITKSDNVEKGAKNANPRVYVKIFVNKLYPKMENLPYQCITMPAENGLAHTAHGTPAL